MSLSAVHISYFAVCQRKLWLFANGVSMEHTSELVSDGKLLHETSYRQRAGKYREILLSATLEDGTVISGKLDYYDSNNKVIHETKRSARIEAAHEWQVKYYLWLLELNGIDGGRAILEYPKLRQTNVVTLDASDKRRLLEVVAEIRALSERETCPGKINSKICKSCSYYELCYIDE